MDYDDEVCWLQKKRSLHSLFFFRLVWPPAHSSSPGLSRVGDNKVTKIEESIRKSAKIIALNYYNTVHYDRVVFFFREKYIQRYTYISQQPKFAL